MLWIQKLLIQFLLLVHCFKKAPKLFYCNLNNNAVLFLCFFVFQVQPVEQAAPIGSPLAFPGPILLPHTSMPPGGAPFIPAEFDCSKLAPGKTSVQDKIVRTFEPSSKRDM